MSEPCKPYAETGSSTEFGYNALDAPVQDAPDIISFDLAVRGCREVFLKRREQYGNHLVNAKRFPKADTAGLYLKCARVVHDIDLNQPIMEDTLRDIANYALIILSTGNYH